MTDERTAYDEKLESILRTAARIFAEKGYHQASIRDIARATGVSLSGLYYYFDSKEELLFLIQDHAFGTLLANLERNLAGVGEPHRRLRILVENHLRYFIDAKAEMKVLSHESESLTGDYRRRVNEKKRRLTETAMEILREIRPEGGIDLRVATFSLFGMMNWLYNWHRPGLDAPVETLVDDMYRIFLDGYLPEGAHVPAEADEGATGEPQPIWRSA
jgi:TetR/AcrR family transcriptional regulator, cholesterol catabolism regulator